MNIHMKNLIYVVVFLIVVFLFYFLTKPANTELVLHEIKVETPAVNKSLSVKNGDPNCNPKFEDYPVDEYKGKIAPIDFSTKPEAREFRTVITTAEKQGPNFAGNYTVATWGCGTGCQEFAVINAKTGEIIHYPNGSNGVYSDTISTLGHQFEYKMNSRLFVVGPPWNITKDDIIWTLDEAKQEKNNGGAQLENLTINYFEFQNDKFKLICQKNYIDALKNK